MLDFCSSDILTRQDIDYVNYFGISLIILAILLFTSRKRKWITNETWVTLVYIATIVAGIAGGYCNIFPETNKPSGILANTQTSIILPTNTPLQEIKTEDTLSERLLLVPKDHPNFESEDPLTRFQYFKTENA